MFEVPKPEEGPAALSINDAETAIQNTQAIFENELTLQNVGSRIHNLTKKLYIPILSCCLDSRKPFTIRKSAHPIEQLLQDLKVIGQYHKQHSSSQPGQALATTTELIIGRFIRTAINGDYTLEQTNIELRPLADECRLRQEQEHLEEAAAAKHEHNKQKYRHDYKEGHWFDYKRKPDENKSIRCKIAGIIRQNDHYIFITRQGGRLLDVSRDELDTMVINKTLIPLSAVSIKSSLEDVLSNIKHAHQLTGEEA